MTTSAHDLLNAFDRLTDTDKREIVSEILRRALAWDVAPLSYQDLVVSAEEIFLELDKTESND